MPAAPIPAGPEYTLQGAGHATPERAAHSEESQARALKRRQAWVREVGYIALSYVVNGVLLSAFALTGTVSWTAGLAYAGPGLAISALTAHIISSGYSLRYADPSLSAVHSMSSAALALVGVAAYPQLAFAYALILFTVMLTATYRINRRWVSVQLAAVSLLFALLTLGLGRQLQLPHANDGEQMLAWLFFVVTLGRCVVLSVINTRNNLLLRERGLQMKAKLAEIDRLARHDELTGAYNRRQILHLLNEELDRQTRSGEPVSVALFDLDHFKAVNDTLGHLAGDEVLRGFAAAVQAQARKTDRFGRYGGEEFLLLLPGANAAQADEAVTRIREGLALHDWSAVSPGLRVTFSAGMATRRDNEPAEMLLGRADLGLYEAKRCGRNCNRAV